MPLEFLYGLPFAVIWLTVAWLPNAALGRDQSSLSRLDLRRGREPDCRNRAAATQYGGAQLAIGVASVAVVLLSLPADDPSRSSIARGWASRSALLAPGSGAAFGIVAAAGHRGAALPGDAVDRLAPRVP